jgi:hypothetical protein
VSAPKVPVPLYRSINRRPDPEALIEGWLERALTWPNEVGLEQLQLDRRIIVEIPQNVDLFLVPFLSSGNSLDQRRIRAVFDRILDDDALVEQAHRRVFAAPKAVRTMAVQLRKDQLVALQNGSATSPARLLSAALVVAEEFRVAQKAFSQRKLGIPLSDRAEKLLTDVARQFRVEPEIAMEKIATHALRHTQLTTKIDTVPASVRLPLDIADRLDMEASVRGRFIQCVIDDLVEREAPLEPIPPSGHGAPSLERSPTVVELSTTVVRQLRTHAKHNGLTEADLLNSVLRLAGPVDRLLVDESSPSEPTTAYASELEEQHRVALREALTTGPQNRPGSGLKNNRRVGAWIEQAIRNHLSSATEELRTAKDEHASIPVRYSRDRRHARSLESIARSQGVTVEDLIAHEVATQLTFTPEPDVPRPPPDERHVKVGMSPSLQGAWNERWREQAATLARGSRDLQGSSRQIVADFVASFEPHDGQDNSGVYIDGETHRLLVDIAEEHGITIAHAAAAAAAAGMGLHSVVDPSDPSIPVDTRPPLEPPIDTPDPKPPRTNLSTPTRPPIRPSTDRSPGSKSHPSGPEM